MKNDETQEDVTLENNVEESETDEETQEETVTDWEAEAKKWKAIAGRKSKKAEQAINTPEISGNIPNSQVERLTLKVDGYNDEEISKIMELGGLKALQNPLVKKAVDLMREERQAENAQVTGGSSTSDFSRKYSQSDLRKMSSEELEKILPKT